MHIGTAKLVYFSPTRTTKKVVEGIAEGIQAEAIEPLDLTLPDTLTREFDAPSDALAIIGTPVFGGRIPLDAIERLRRLKGNNTPAAILVVYGNRAYEDALIELKDIVTEAGFLPVAGGAFIGEHSFSRHAMPIANGRPDTEDLKRAREFGERVWKKMMAIQTLDDLPPLQVPGNSPYRERRTFSDISPITDEGLCTSCETCVSVCPKGAITIDEKVMTDPRACIVCHACIKNCPTGARRMENARMKQLAERLYTNCQERREPETYLG